MTDAPEEPIVDPEDEETPVPEEQQDQEEFVPTLSVTEQGAFHIVTQERTRGDVQTIYLDADQSKSVGWALLTPDAATEDQSQPVTDPGFVQQGGRFT